MRPQRAPRVAVVHERFTEYAGSERVVEQLMEIWPQADLYAPVCDPQALHAGLAGRQVRVSALQRLYPGSGRYAHLLPLLPMAMRAFDLSGYDLVVTSHHAFANRVRVRGRTRLLSYTHSPARWIWDASLRAEEAGRVGRAGLTAFAATQRAADRAAAARVDTILANSSAVADRVRSSWRQTAGVVHPPVDIERYRPAAAGSGREDFFLLAGRLVPYKRPHVAAAAAARAGVRLVVVGDGRFRSAVEQAGGPAVAVLGRVSDDELRSLYQRCRALVMPGVEDFGIVPVEAQACGAPVVALGEGGSRDTVVDGVTGRLYADEPADPAAPLAAALASFDPSVYDPDRIRAHAEGFAPALFRERIRTAAAALL
jgi:glycosyltransferase involved in cell wall biosynthesis